VLALVVLGVGALESVRLVEGRKEAGLDTWIKR
jgi:hypothetical protein